MSRIVGVKELSKEFGIGLSALHRLLKIKGSPAFKIGTGKTASWRCDADEFKAWLLKRSEEQKG